MSDLDPKMFDNRVVKHHLRRGDISEDQLQRWLDALPDESEEALETETVFVNTFETRGGTGDSKA